MLLLAMVQGVECMADVVLTVKNSGQEQRLEVAEFDANEVWKALGVAQGSPVRVLNPYGLPEACQITHDNKLLVETTVIAQSLMRRSMRKRLQDYRMNLKQSMKKSVV